jgi:hypothetical protein
MSLRVKFKDEALYNIFNEHYALVNKIRLCKTFLNQICIKIRLKVF